MKKYALAALLAFVLYLGSAAAQSPRKQYGFAEQLRQDGDNVLALLEYRRFAYMYPDHDRAPDALMHAARTRLLHTGEPAKAERTLKRITDEYPGTSMADRASQLRTFVAENSDYGGEPLAIYMRARQAAQDGRHAKAVRLYESIPDRWQDAQLADDAMLAAAKVHLQKADEPGKAREKLDALLDMYPNRETAVEARYRRAEAIAESEDSRQDPLQAYRRIKDEYPDSEWAERADRRIDELKEERSALERTYRSSLVRDYEVMSTGYEDRTRYVKKIELSSNSSMQQVRATLEDALIKAVDERRNQDDAVTVEAYYTYPVSDAGDVEWRPGGEPKYDVDERDTGDRLRDSLFDRLTR